MTAKMNIEELKTLARQVGAQNYDSSDTDCKLSMTHKYEMRTGFNDAQLLEFAQMLLKDRQPTKEIEEIIVLETRVRKFRERVLELTVGTCTCLTKTPEPEYHDSSCLYKRARDILSNDDSAINHWQ